MQVFVGSIRRRAAPTDRAWRDGSRRRRGGSDAATERQRVHLQNCALACTRVGVIAVMRSLYFRISESMQRKFCYFTS
jgi:hypothetical protein